MEVLVRYPDISVTNLAMLSRMNHGRCNDFLQNLEKRGYVVLKSQGKKKQVTLTQSGAELGRKLIDLCRNEKLYSGLTECTYNA
jgi:predicted transcriptional regulator